MGLRFIVGGCLHCWVGCWSIGMRIEVGGAAGIYGRIMAWGEALIAGGIKAWIEACIAESIKAWIKVRIDG